jgi:hypothetical protein
MMGSETAPEFPGDSVATGIAAQTFEVADLSDAKKKWLLAVHPAHLALSDSTTSQPYILLRECFPKNFNYMEGMQVLGVTKPFKVTLKLTPEAATAVTAWFGAPFLAANYLKRRYGFVLPWAIIWMIGALPMPGSVAAGLEAKPFHLLDFFLGASLVIAWALAKWRPHPGLFVIDFLWFGWIAVSLTLSVFEGRSKLWLLLVCLLGWMAVTGLKHFIRFRGTVIPRLQKGSAGKNAR